MKGNGGLPSSLRVIVPSSSARLPPSWRAVSPIVCPNTCVSSGRLFSGESGWCSKSADIPPIDELTLNARPTSLYPQKRTLELRCAKSALCEAHSRVDELGRRGKLPLRLEARSGHAGRVVLCALSVCS